MRKNLTLASLCFLITFAFSCEKEDVRKEVVNKNQSNKSKVSQELAKKVALNFMNGAMSMDNENGLKKTQKKKLFGPTSSKT